MCPVSNRIAGASADTAGDGGARIEYPVVFVSKIRSSVIGLALAAALAAASCGSCRGPAVPDATYREAVTAFHTALAALETSQEPLARQKLDRVIALVPQEPAGWANLGLLLLRQQETGPAKERLSKA